MKGRKCCCNIFRENRRNRLIRNVRIFFNFPYSAFIFHLSSLESCVLHTFTDIKIHMNRISWKQFFSPLRPFQRHHRSVLQMFKVTDGLQVISGIQPIQIHMHQFEARSIVLIREGKCGLVTGRSSPKAMATPCMNVVFPAPRSPCNATTVPGERISATSAATAQVSSTELILYVFFIMIINKRYIILSNTALKGLTTN